jgi:hypothetical protein
VGAVEAALDRIEQAVDSGRTELSDLGFWKLLMRVKAEPTLAERVADQVGRIDRKAFEARVRPRFPVWLGNLVLCAGILAGVAAMVVAARVETGWLAGLALVAAAGLWSASVHGLAHWLVGRALGIRFWCYFFGGPPPPRPGLKSDYATYVRATPRARAWMHASGAIATKLAPFLVAALYPATNAPAWALWVVLAIGIAQILTDIAFSTKTSDWMKFSREIRLARTRAS